MPLLFSSQSSDNQHNIFYPNIYPTNYEHLLDYSNKSINQIVEEKRAVIKDYTMPDEQGYNNLPSHDLIIEH